MSLQVENLEKNMAKLTVEVPAEKFEEAIKTAYNKNKNRFAIPGFRKGKAPLNMIEKMYGVQAFYEEAANIVLDETYPEAAAESIAQSQGVTAEAAGYLAQVKARANMEGKTVAAITADLQKLGKQAFIEECWTERLREFPLEFKIWDDCLRTGKFPVISSTEKGKVTYVDLVGAKNASGATFKSSDLLWPISLNEMQRNPSLTQNEGYAVQ